MSKIRTEQKEIGGVRYETTSLGARRQMEMLPKILRLARGPAGTLLTGLVHTLQSVPMEEVLRVTKDLDPGDLAKDPARLAALIQLMPATTVDRAHVSTTLAELSEDLIAVGGPGFFDELFASTLTIDGGARSRLEDAFDVHFDGRLTQLVKVCAWVVEFNFAPFLRSSLRSSAAGLQSWSSASSPASTSGDSAPT
jgi:hypothetical protein